jgi:two-component system, cell cycle sensor histidine kinase and response regulator CckA
MVPASWLMSALPQPDPESVAPEVRQRQRAEAERMETIGRLVSGVAHDFNNLLTGIMLCSDLLLAGLEQKSRLRRYAEEIRTAGAQGAGMIQNLLAMASQQRQGPTRLSLNDSIADVRRLLTRLIGENIELCTDLADDLKLVKIDPAEAQQIILNLVVNARDAMPDGGQITLRTRNRQASTEAQGCVELSVRDTGVGMDAETRARVFEPFFTTKKNGNGTGLGLATVHRIVKQQGGTIALESEMGAGTRITICLTQAESQSDGWARNSGAEDAGESGTWRQPEMPDAENSKGRKAI